MSDSQQSVETIKALIWRPGQIESSLSPESNQKFSVKPTGDDCQRLASNHLEVDHDFLTSPVIVSRVRRHDKRFKMNVYDKRFKKNVYRHMYSTVRKCLRNHNEQLKVHPESARNMSGKEFLEFMEKLTRQQKLSLLKSVRSNEFKCFFICGRTKKYSESESLQHMNWIKWILISCLRPTGDMVPNLGILNNTY